MKVQYTGNSYHGEEPGVDGIAPVASYFSWEEDSSFPWFHLNSIQGIPKESAPVERGPIICDCPRMSDL